MKNRLWLNLQLFAGEGTGDGGGEGAATTGENATVDAEQKLRDLGVPEDKIRRRANRNAAKPTASTASTARTVSTAPKESTTAEPNAQDAAATEAPTEETNANAPRRMTWDEIMADPEYNKNMQSVVQSRLKSAKGAEETLGKITPALELLARKHGLDPANIDYDALAKKINDDDGYYEDKALSMGVSVETAKQIDQQERDTARKQREEARTVEDQKLRAHFDKITREGEALKKVFPNFDLRKELQNPAFARMTSPNVGISVEDAYYAVHRNEIQAAAMQATAQRTAQNISKSIQAGSRRPDEAGASGQAPSVTTFDYSKMSRKDQLAFKKDVMARLNRGEKVYPGGRR